MKKTRNGILIPDVPIMAGGNLPNAVKGVSAGGADWKKHAVDMGLPSGTLWADCDIDVNMPDGFCVTPFIYEKSFFSWGNVDGHNPVANRFEYAFTEANYQNTDGASLSTSIPDTAEYDAARFNCGEAWLIPTIGQFGELAANSEYIDENGSAIPTERTDKRVTVNGVRGIFLRSKINGKTIFLSASGNVNNLNWGNKNVAGYYYSKELSGQNVQMIYYANAIENLLWPRWSGTPIRPVVNKNIV